MACRVLSASVSPQSDGSYDLWGWFSAIDDTSNVYYQIRIETSDNATYIYGLKDIYRDGTIHPCRWKDGGVQSGVMLVYTYDEEEVRSLLVAAVVFAGLWATPVVIWWFGLLWEDFRRCGRKCFRCCGGGFICACGRPPTSYLEINNGAA